MGKKPAAALAANLVATKGAAAPAPDMPGRGAPSQPEQAAPRKSEASEGEGGSGLPLNFRVSAAFRTEFKVYAAQHGLKLNELLRLSFEAYRRQTS